MERAGEPSCALLRAPPVSPEARCAYPAPPADESARFLRQDQGHTPGRGIDSRPSTAESMQRVNPRAVQTVFGNSVRSFCGPRPVHSSTAMVRPMPGAGSVCAATNSCRRLTPLAADMPRRHPRSLRRSSGWRAIVGTAPHRGRRPGREAARRSAIRRGPRSKGWNRFNRRRLLRSDSPARHPINRLLSLHHSTHQTASNVSRESKASMHHHAAGGHANGVSE
jgi:hypothetical protein